MHQPARHALRCAQADDVLALESHLAAGDLAALRRQQTADGLERGALAGAVSAEEGDHVAIPDFQRDPFNGEEHLVVDDLDIAQGQHVYRLSLNFAESLWISRQTSSW